MDHYTITVEGHIEDYWADELGGFNITRMPGGTTSLSGDVLDQSELQGVLTRIGDLGLVLVELRKSVEGPTPP